MDGDLNRARRQLGRLRAFASVTTRAHPRTDAIVLDLLTRRDRFAGDSAALYRELYLRLQPLAAASGARPAPRAATEHWTDFDKLRVVQRSAVFLVFGLDYSLEEAAAIVGEAEDRLVMEVIAAMFSLEHLLPAERAAARARGRRLREALAARARRRPEVGRPPPRPARPPRPATHPLQS